MKNLLTRGVYRPFQNQMFRRGQTDGTFGNAPRMDDEDYLTGYECGRKFRAEMIAAGAKVRQPSLFDDQFRGQ
jgi:hypothetical protein